MKIAIQPLKGSFSDRWIEYCKSNHIEYKLVECHSSDIIQQLEDCDALMWHFHHVSPKDFLFAKQLLYSVQLSGKAVFPDFNTVWHFDDKVGQKYLLESLRLQIVPSYVFYTKIEALNWAKSASYPKVFKLRGGAGSVNVKLVKSFKEACKLIKKSFGKGHIHSSVVPFSEIWNKYKRGKISTNMLIRSFARLFIKTDFEKVHGREKGYVYFQNFIQNNDHDIRVIIIKNKAFAIKRKVRRGDFRASGSGNILYQKELFNEKLILLSFENAEKLKSQCIAFDYVFDNDLPLIVEISYGFSPEGYDPCPGYWDKHLTWHEGEFSPYGWMVDSLIEE